MKNNLRWGISGFIFWGNSSAKNPLTIKFHRDILFVQYKIKKGGFDVEKSSQNSNVDSHLCGNFYLHSQFFRQAVG
jgi:hypothetical protein